LAASYRERAERLPPDSPPADPLEDRVARHLVTRQKPLAEVGQLMQQGKKEEAIALLQRMVRDAPDAENCFALGATLTHEGQFEEGATYLRQSLAHDASNPAAHLELGLAYLAQAELLEATGERGARSRRLLEKAVAAEDEALKLQNNLAEAHHLRGRALAHLGRTKEALEALHEAIRCKPENPEMHLSLGETLAEAGQFDKAIERLETAVRLRPNDPRFQAALDHWRAKKPE